MEINSLKILIPIAGFGRSGGMRVLSQLANNWKALGHNVSFVCSYLSDNPYFPCEAKIIWVDVDGNVRDSNNPNFRTSNLGIKRIYSLYKYLQKNSSGYDVLFANQNQTAWPVWIAGRSLKVYYIQAYEPEFYHLQNLKGLFQKLFSWLTYLIPISKVVNAEIYKNYKNLKSEHVIPPGLDLSVYFPKEIPVNPDRVPVVGCIGRKEKWKGSEDVASAIKMLHNTGHNIIFKVAFNPVKYENHTLIIPDGDNNLAEFYRSLDILVAPGQLQLGAIHYPVIEAMASKTTVITTGYYPANIDNSYIIPVKSPEKIAQAILEIINNPILAGIKSEIAYNDIQQFDWKIVSKKFIELFHVMEMRNDTKRKS